MSQQQINTCKPITPRGFTLAVVGEIAAKHGVTTSDILGPSRVRKFIPARFEAIATIAEMRPDWSYPVIGRFFNRDHTTIMHALDQVGARRIGKAKPDQVLEAVRSVTTFIQSYEAVADQKEYEAALSVARFVSLFVLPKWARGA